MATHVGHPVRLEGRLDPELSRWMWLVKWLLVIPHYIVLFFLFFAFAVLSIVAFFAILLTGRYPRGIFDFNVGVLRWSWRVSYYAYGALATDRYPPFTLDEVPDYPAKLEVAYPERLSRGLVLVKWLLALPHYLVVGVLAGGSWFVLQNDEWQVAGTGLIGVLAIIAGVVLLFTGAYPPALFDVILGFNRWVIRVAAYVGLMTDQYPPFRLDSGGSENAGTLPMNPAVDPAGSRTTHWGPGSVIALIAAVLLASGAVTLGSAGGVGLWADQTQRDVAGFVTTERETMSTEAHALVAESIDLDVDGAPSYLPADLLGDARIRTTSNDGSELFIGIAPADKASAYLAGTSYAVTDDFQGHVETTRQGGAPSTLPGDSNIWVASSEGSGTQSVTWTPKAGEWTVVAMNADGSPNVSISGDVGLEVPSLTGVSVGLIAIGAVLLFAAGGIVIAAVAGARRRR